MVKNLPANVGLITGWGRSPGEGNDNSLQCSCLGNPMDRGAWRATVHGVAKESDTTERLNTNKQRKRKQPPGKSKSVYRHRKVLISVVHDSVLNGIS